MIRATPRPDNSSPAHFPSSTFQAMTASLPAMPTSPFAKQGPVYTSHVRASRYSPEISDAAPMDTTPTVARQPNNKPSDRISHSLPVKSETIARTCANFRMRTIAGQGRLQAWLPMLPMRFIATAAGMAADAIADELIVGAIDPLRLAAPEVAVAGHAFGFTQSEIQVHSLAAQAQAPRALRFH